VLLVQGEYSAQVRADGYRATLSCSSFSSHLRRPQQRSAAHCKHTTSARPCSERKRAIPVAVRRTFWRAIAEVRASVSRFLLGCKSRAVWQHRARVRLCACVRACGCVHACARAPLVEHRAHVRDLAVKPTKRRRWRHGCQRQPCQTLQCTQHNRQTGRGNPPPANAGAINRAERTPPRGVDIDRSLAADRRGADGAWLPVAEQRLNRMDVRALR
jgi:hypothetical protein